MKKLALLMLVFCSVMSWSQSAPPKRAEVLVLGTYHMANPGRDVFNMQADDVLSPKRQQEMTDLLTVLKRFKPTKIAVEATVYEDKIPKRYADYLAGKYQLSRNEIDQIGLRLAKELNLKTVYPVDYDGEFPMERLLNFTKAKGKSAEMDQLMSEIGTMVKQQDAYLHSHTIVETMVYMNADKKAAEDVGFYYRQAHYGEPGDYAGPDLLASWYQRNIRIYNNITNIIDSPDERILVIYGAGHLGWLQQDIANDPTLKLRKFSEFVDTKGAQ